MMKNNFFLYPIGRLFTITFLFIFSSSFAQTVYYANNVTGNDSNSGLSAAAPKKTFTSVFATAPAGSIIDLTGTFTWSDVGETTAVTSGFTINKNMTIRGQGADQTIVQANALPNVANRRVFTINSGVTVIFEKLTIQNGKVANLDNTVYPADGGGLYNSGTLTLNYCRISQNYAIAGGSFSGGAGGGIMHMANNTMTINGCTFDNNQANTGGALTNEFNNASGRFIITNSTFAYNKQLALVATVGGGAIWILNGTNIITNSTFAYNDLNNSNGSGTGNGASILVRQGNVRLKNSIFVNGTRSGQPLSASGRTEIAFSGGSATDEGNNIFGVQSGITFSSTSWQPSAGGGYQNVGDTSRKCQLSVDTSLETNGATNGIVTLKITGFNINAGSSVANNGVDIPTIDQRGVTRIGTPDIGAYEYIDQAPIVSCFSPSTGPAGTSISISGVNFSGATSVTFNGVEATSFTVNSSESVTAVAPESSTGLIGITTAQGTGNSFSNYVYPPSIQITGTLSPFFKCSGSASSAQTFTISGANLTANILVVAYTGLEYSLDGTSYSGSLSLSPTNSTVVSTTIYVRMTSASTSLTSGNISLTSTGATPQTIAVSGTVNATIPTPTITAPTVQSFTSLGSTTWTAPVGVTSVEYLVVGGGGGGANGYDNGGGGGGGAGMVLTGRLAVIPGTAYPIVIGDGGNGGANTRVSNWGAIGQNSVLGTLIALGGGAGKGSRTVAVAGIAQNSNCAAGTGAGGSGGGNGGKGGGGAVGNGNNNSGVTGGAGGAGKSSSITGTAITYGVGGAGGSNATSATGASGTSNRGNGGNAGTAGSSSSAAGGKGGSGIVVLKYVTQATSISYCQGESALPLQATALAGNTLQWYTVATGGVPSTIAPTPDTTVSGTTTYYVSQKNDTSGCESSRISITVTINELPLAPTTTNSFVNYCQGDTASPLAATSTLGSTLQWYEGSNTLNSCAPTPSTAVIGTTTYYVSQISAAGCQGPQTTITVNVYEVPSTPIASNVTLCANTTASPLTALTTTGNTLQWYTVPTGGTATTTAPTPTTTISGTTIYYVSQKNDITGCEGPRTAINVTILGANTWTGATNNLWNVASNWSCGVVPDASNDIVISSGSPILNTDLTIPVGKSLTISGTGVLIIAPGKVLTIAGSADFGGKAVLFQSDATGSGVFGPLTGTLMGANNIQVERYIPARRAFRFLSPSVTTTTSIRANWQNGGVNTSGLGTHITGVNGTTNGFDATSTNNPSLFTFDNGVWSAVTNTNTNVLTAGTPYRLMVRGDRTTDLTSNTPTATATTLRATGTLRTGNFTPSLNPSADGFSLVGNPYQAPIDIKAILNASTNMSTNVVYYWDPTLNVRGGYVTRDLTTDVNDVTSSFNQYVQPGQAVFVKKDNTANVPTMTITEANKSVVNASAGVFRQSNATDSGFIRANLQANINNQWQTTDATLAVFNDSFSWDVTSADATKMSNLDEEVSFVQNNTNLAIATQSNPIATSELPIKIDKLRHTNYQWQFELDNYRGATPYLYDMTNNSYTQINNGTVVSFTADLSTTNRFKIVFQNSALSTDDFTNNIKLYPNPAKAGASFYVDGITEATVSVYNIVGQNIPIQTISQGNTLQVTPSVSLSKGVYLVNITIDNTTKQVKWVVE